MLLACIRSCLKSVRRYKLLYWYLPYEIYINVSKDVRILGYLSKPIGVGEQKKLGDTALELGDNRVV